MENVEEPPGSQQVESFWVDAKVHARLNPAGSYFGPTTLEVVRPVNWSYGETPDEANAFASQVLAHGTATVTTPVSAYADGELPEAGTLSILCDGQGEPCALLAAESVAVDGESVVEVLTVVYSAT